ncbi:MAG: endonuclease 4 [Planctomycetota bacterium]|jgi:sugar phosphate isomerase/epimerase
MTISRRQLFGMTAAAAATAVCPSLNAAADPPQRTKGSHLKLSLAGYSFNRLMARRGTPEQIQKAEMSLEKLIMFCAEHGLGAAELTGYYFPAQITPAYLMSLRSLAHRNGVGISGTAIGNDFCLPDGEARQQQLAECRQWIDYAALMQAPAIRIFAGKVPAGDTEDAAVARCAAGINECLQYASEKGVFLALENHGGITSTPAQMLKIIQQVQPSEFFGVNFDSGNFQTADPYADLQQIAPWAVNAQIKASISVDGKKQPADYGRIVRILRDAGYRGFVALEYEESESPFAAIPRILDQLRPLMDG